MLFFSLLFASTISLASLQTAEPVSVPSEVYVAKDFSRLKGMAGFSDDLLNIHFQLYQGYVTHTNLLLNALKNADKKDADVYAGLKRRLGWEFDGMRLHEMYFENLGGKHILSAYTPLYKALVKEFGSFEAWKADFIATGAMRGIGWAILYRDPVTGRLMNVWINEHDLGHLAGGAPLLVMDVFEHAYITQYGLDRAKYIEAFFANINWDVVSGRASLHSRTSTSAGNYLRSADSRR